MTKIKTLILLVVLSIMAVLQSDAATLGKKQSQDMIREAAACSSEEAAKPLIAKYQKLGDPHKHLYIGIVYHNLSGTGNLQYLDKALEYLKKAVDTGGSATANGYYGSTMTIQAGKFFQEGDMQGAMQNLENGLQLLDKAVTTEPGNITLRVLRIENSYGISKSSPVNRFDKIDEDLGVLEKHYKALPVQLKSFFHLFSGLSALEKNKTDQAVTCFEKAIRTAPKSYYAGIAKKNIRKLEQ
jgi:tetratricopeptide (TPR) repeat protein